jgi:hypothetical protein
VWLPIPQQLEELRWMLAITLGLGLVGAWASRGLDRRLHHLTAFTALCLLGLVVLHLRFVVTVTYQRAGVSEQVGYLIGHRLTDQGERIADEIAGEARRSGSGGAYLIESLGAAAIPAMWQNVPLVIAGYATTLFLVALSGAACLGLAALRLSSDLAPSRAWSNPSEGSMASASTLEIVGRSVFVSYAHEDEAWKNRVVTQLNVLQHELQVWDDSRIGAGADWLREIETAMGSCGVALFLVSADFLTSKFVLETEVPQLLERRKHDGLIVIPVVVKPCAWSRLPWLQGIQARPKGGALTGMTEHDADAALAGLAAEIAELL